MDNVLAAQGHISLGNKLLVPLNDASDVDVVVANFTRVNVDPAGLSKTQEGEKAQQVDCGDEGKHRRPRACDFDEIPREIHH